VKNFIGRTIDNKYNIRERLGKGGMGSVYLVKDLKIDAFRAMKIIDKNAKNNGLDPLTEVNIMKLAQHPYLPSVMDVSEDNDYVYIIMELISGTTLNSVLTMNKRVDEEKVVKWTRDLCDALYYLHTGLESKIIYKDLKPSNIMVNSDGEKITLIDFGISQMMNNDYEKNIPIGTKGYAPLEQFKESPIDERVDIYALGATIYHLLTGKGPKSFSNGFVPLRQIDPNLSEGIEYIAYKCVQENPNDRYSSVKEIIEDLDNIKIIGEQYEIKLKQKKNKFLLQLSGAGISLLVALGGWFGVEKSIATKYNLLIEEGIEARDELQNDKMALEKFEEAKSYMSKSNLAHYEIAKTNIQNGKLYDNIIYISKLMEKSSSKRNDPNFNYLLGKSYFLQGQGNYQKALEYFGKIEEKDEDKVDNDFKYLKVIIEQLSEFDKNETLDKTKLNIALEDFGGYIDSIKNNNRSLAINLYRTLADVYQTLPSNIIEDKNKTRIYVLKKAYEIDSSDYSTMEYLARAYRDKARDIRMTNTKERDDNLKESIEMYNRCYEKLPTIETLKNLGELYLEAGNVGQAESTFQRMITQYTDHYLGYVKMAALKKQQGNRQVAIDYLNQAEECSGSNPENDIQYTMLKDELGLE